MTIEIPVSCSEDSDAAVKAKVTSCDQGDCFLVYWEDRNFGVVKREDLVNITVSEIPVGEEFGKQCSAIYGDSHFKVALLFRGDDEDKLCTMAQLLDAHARNVQKNKKANEKKRKPKKRKMTDFEMESTLTDSENTNDSNRLQAERVSVLSPKKKRKESKKQNGDTSNSAQTNSASHNDITQQNVPIETFTDAGSESRKSKAKEILQRRRDRTEKKSAETDADTDPVSGHAETTPIRPNQLGSDNLDTPLSAAKSHKRAPVLPTLDLEESLEDELWNKILKKLSTVEKKFRKMEAEVDSLKEENDSLKEENKAFSRRLKKLEKKAKKNLLKSSGSDQDQTDFIFNSVTETQLRNLVKAESRLQTACKLLLINTFGEDYVVCHSMTGRAGNKQMNAKPVMDVKALGLIRTILKEKFSVSDAEITAKILNLQKALRLKNKQPGTD